MKKVASRMYRPERNCEIVSKEWNTEEVLSSYLLERRFSDFNNIKISGINIINYIKRRNRRVGAEKDYKRQNNWN